MRRNSSAVIGGGKRLGKILTPLRHPERWREFIGPVAPIFRGRWLTYSVAYIRLTLAHVGLMPSALSQQSSRSRRSSPAERDGRRKPSPPRRAGKANNENPFLSAEVEPSCWRTPAGEILSEPTGEPKEPARRP